MAAYKNNMSDETVVRLRKSIFTGGPLESSACKNTFIFAKMQARA
jgi:hypothetical protein